jgi:hypothetical protein
VRAGRIAKPLPEIMIGLLAKVTVSSLYNISRIAYHLNIARFFERLKPYGCRYDLRLIIRSVSQIFPYDLMLSLPFPADIDEDCHGPCPRHLLAVAERASITHDSYSLHNLSVNYILSEVMWEALREMETRRTISNRRVSVSSIIEVRRADVVGLDKP